MKRAAADSPVEAPSGDRPRHDLRHHAARRRAVAGLQHDPGREAAPGARSSSGSAWTSSRPASRSPRRATSRRCRRSPRRCSGAEVAALAPRQARATSRPAGRALAGAAPPAHPHLPRHVGHPPQAQAARSRRGGAARRRSRASRCARTLCADVEFSAEDASRTDYGFLHEVLQAVHEAGARDAQHARHGRLRAARTSTRAMVGKLRARHPGGRDLRALPQRPRPGGRQLAGRGPAGARQVECTINGIGERAGNTVARGGRDGAQGAPRDAAASTPASTPSSSPRRSRLLSTRHRRLAAAEQGDRRRATPSPTRRASTRTACWRTRSRYEIMTPASVGAARDASSCSASTPGRHAVAVAPARARRRARGRGARGRHRAGQGAGRPEEVRLRRGPARARRRTRPSARAHAGALPGRVAATRSCPPPRSRSRSDGAAAARPRRSATARSTPRSRPPTRRSAASCELLELHTRAVTAGKDALGRGDGARARTTGIESHRPGARAPTSIEASAQGVPLVRSASARRAPRAGGLGGDACRARARSFEKIWDAHVVAPATAETPAVLYVDLHLVHEVTSPQAFAGAARARPAACGAPTARVATMDHSTPTTPRARRPARRGRRRRGATQVRALEENCREFGIPLYALGDERQGIVHVIGPELGLTQPGHDDRVRRQPHQHPRRVRRARLRHRHERGRARARDAVPAASAGRRRSRSTFDGRARAGRHREGPDPRADRADRRRRRHRPRHRVPRRGDPRARHGRAHDGLQHVDRGRRARRHDRARRHHVRVPGRPARTRRKGAAWDAAVARWRALPTDEGARVRPRR